jgi:ankyrin repeat protein
MLLDRNAAIESKDRFIGYTSLLFAAEHGHEAVVKLLLEGRADTESKNEYGQTPLSCAVMIRNEAVVKLLQSAASLHGLSPPHPPPHHPNSLI